MPSILPLDPITLEHVTIEDLRPDPFNPRRISDAELEVLIRGIQEFGLVDPIIARRDDRDQELPRRCHRRVERTGSELQPHVRQRGGRPTMKSWCACPCRTSAPWRL